mgnify:CR=1 FL=1
MKITDLQTGTKLELQIYDDSGRGIKPAFSSKFEFAPDEGSAVIDSPMREGNVFPVRVGWNMDVYFTMKDDLYKFNSSVLQRWTRGNLSFLKLEVLGDIRKIQRREFFRLESNVPVKYRIIKLSTDDKDNKEPMKSCVTKDLSGGGLCLRIREEVERNSLIKGEVDLGPEKKIPFVGEVIRVDIIDGGKKYKYEIGISFKKIKKNDKEEIIRFIYSEQRRLRRKGFI